MTTMRSRKLRNSLLVLSVAVVALLGWATADLRAANVLTLQSCMEAEAGVRAWICRQALYHLHPTQEEVKELNASAGAQFPASMENLSDATQLLQHYLRAGLDINAVDQRSQLKWTALHAAAFEGNPQAVRLLLDNGAETHTKDGIGRTPLDIAREANTKMPSEAFAQIVAMLAGKEGAAAN